MKLNRMTRLFPLVSTFLLGATLLGCSDRPSTPSGEGTAVAKSGTPPTADADEVAAERAKLSPGDRASVEAQEWCVVQTDERLGAMGAPIKLDVKGQTVFVCCKSCKKKAEADPDKTLAKLDELKAKARAEKTAK
jgi:hypothetical protein